MTSFHPTPDLDDRFADARSRPALDLLARVGDLPAGDIVELGCGNGTVGPALAARFPDRRIVGLDTSPAMLAQARATGAYAALEDADIADWTPETPPALIFSDGALQWFGDHDTLLRALVDRLAPGGVLAMQIPRQNRAPSHRIWRDLIEDHFPGRAAQVAQHAAPDPVEYYRTLAPLGRLDLWVTEYFQTLAPSDEGHPVRHFTAASFARPILELLDDDETAMIEKLYDEAMEAAYPRADDGTVLFPYRRLFFALDIG